MVLWGGIVAELVVGVVGVRPDDGDAAYVVGQGRAVALFGALIGQFGQIVGLEFYAV